MVWVARTISKGIESWRQSLFFVGYSLPFLHGYLWYEMCDSVAYGSSAQGHGTLFGQHLWNQQNYRPIWNHILCFAKEGQAIILSASVPSQFYGWYWLYYYYISWIRWHYLSRLHPKHPRPRHDVHLLLLVVGELVGAKKHLVEEIHHSRPTFPVRICGDSSHQNHVTPQLQLLQATNVDMHAC